MGRIRGQGKTENKRVREDRVNGRACEMKKWDRRGVSEGMNQWAMK